MSPSAVPANVESHKPLDLTPTQTEIPLNGSICDELNVYSPKNGAPGSQLHWHRVTEWGFLYSGSILFSAVDVEKREVASWPSAGHRWMERVLYQSSERLPPGAKLPSPWMVSISGLLRIQDSISRLLLIFLIFLFINRVDSTPDRLFLSNKGMQSFLLAILINEFVSFPAAASMMWITQVSFEKRIQKGHSNVLSYPVLILATGLSIYVFEDVKFDKRDRLSFVILIISFGIWLFGFVRTTRLCRNDGCSNCHGKGCNNCGKGCASGGGA